MKGTASRIPGCQRIAIRLEAERMRCKQLLLLCERAFGPRTATVAQRAFVCQVADGLERRITELDYLIQLGSELPGRANVDAHRAKVARKRPQMPVDAADRWQVGLYEH